MQRKYEIGGSFIPTILGINPFESAFDLWARLREGVSLPETPAMRVGKLIEPEIIRALRIPGEHQLRITHPEYPQLVGTIDVLSPDGCIWEIKTTRSPHLEMYIPQIMWYLHLFALQRGPSVSGKLVIWQYQTAPERILQLIVKYGLGICQMLGEATTLDVEYDGRRAATLEKAALEFWNCLRFDRPPRPPQNVEEVRRIWSIADPNKTRVATEEDIHDIELLRHLNREKSELERRADEIKTRLMLRLGDAHTLTDADGRTLVSFRNESRRTFDQHKFRSEHPDIYERYVILSTTRVFRILQEAKTKEVDR